MSILPSVFVSQRSPYIVYSLCRIFPVRCSDPSLPSMLITRSSSFKGHIHLPRVHRYFFPPCVLLRHCGYCHEITSAYPIPLPPCATLFPTRPHLPSPTHSHQFSQLTSHKAAKPVYISDLAIGPRALSQSVYDSPPRILRSKGRRRRGQVSTMGQDRSWAGGRLSTYSAFLNRALIRSME